MNKILFVTEGYPGIGGVGRSCFRISKLMAKKGFSVEILVVSEDVQSGKVGHAGLLSINPRLSSFGTKYTQEGYKYRELEAAGLYFSFSGLLSKKKYSLCIVFYAGRTLFPMAYSCAKYGVPYIVAFRGNDATQRIFDPSNLQIIKFALRNASATTFVAQDLRENIKRLYPEFKGGEIIYNSIDVELLKRRSKFKKSKRVTLSGMLQEKKGIERFLIRLPSNFYEKYEVEVVGEIDPEVRNLLPNVSVSGVVSPSEVKNRLVRSRIYISPALAEGCPNTLLDCMALGVPVAATKVGAAADLLDFDIVEGIDVFDLDATIRRLPNILSDSKRLQTISDHVRAVAIEKLSPEREGDCWETLIIGAML